MRQPRRTASVRNLLATQLDLMRVNPWWPLYGLTWSAKTKIGPFGSLASIFVIMWIWINEFKRGWGWVGYNPAFSGTVYLVARITLSFLATLLVLFLAQLGASLQRARGEPSFGLLVPLLVVITVGIWAPWMLLPLAVVAVLGLTIYTKKVWQAVVLLGPMSLTVGAVWLAAFLAAFFSVRAVCQKCALPRTNLNPFRGEIRVEVLPQFDSAEATRQGPAPGSWPAQQTEQAATNAPSFFASETAIGPVQTATMACIMTQWVTGPDLSGSTPTPATPVP